MPRRSDAHVIPLPRTPPEGECQRSAPHRTRASLAGGPVAGRYTYRVVGSQVSLTERRERRPLPDTMTVVITPSTHAGGLLCFAMQRRLTPSLAETEWFATTGAALYVPRVLLETAHSALPIAPKPPFLALSGRRRTWSGSFGGRTHGRFSGRILGRRVIRVGGTAVRAVHVSLDVRFAGEATGAQHAERWFSVRRALLLREQVFGWRRVGLDDLQVRYRATLARGPAGLERYGRDRAGREARPREGPSGGVMRPRAARRASSRARGV